jgi:hypothetical protein
MPNTDASYLKMILLHLLLGVAVFLFRPLSVGYAALLLIFGCYFIIKNKNAHNEVLFWSAYIVGAEVFLRMTKGNIGNEFAKYGVIIFMSLGMYFSGISKKTISYWIFLLLLVPGIVLGFLNLSFEADVRKAVIFNILGPFCLGLSSIYCYERKITFDRLLGVITAFSLPLVAIAVYLFLFTPSVKDVVTGTASNSETSGGFGPNQVATILGFGIFVFFVQLLLNSKSRLLQIVNAGFVLTFAFRGLVTFSRGGIITAMAMIFLLIMVLYFRANFTTRPKIGLIIIFSCLAGLGVWGYSSIQTRGLINKRYANEDALGREKKSQLSGREELMATELQMFLDNPIFGVGVGRNKEIREKETGILLPSHNEITRMLAEHGSLGLMGLIILLFTPVLLFINNRQNILALSFVVFWLLTINHAAMRLAAPAFVYALSLLKVYTVEEPAVHRE